MVLSKVNIPPYSPSSSDKSAREGMESMNLKMESPASGTPMVGISRRRNGLQPACEPCRKAKVRCDHATTRGVCSRCRKRQNASQCVVLNAPMTSHLARPAIPKSKPRAQSSNSNSNGTGSSGSPAQTPRTGVSGAIERIPDTTGYFGSTSFSSTLRQAAAGLTEIQEEFDNDPQSLGTNLELAMKVLRQIPAQDVCERLVDCYVKNSGEVGFSKAVVRHISERIWAVYGHKLVEPRSYQAIEDIAREWTKNTRSPLYSPDDAEGWKNSFTGVNTRWETLGMVFCAFSFGAAAIDEKDPIFSDENGDEIGRGNHVSAMKSGVEMCVQLCGNSLNILTCNLLYKNLHLETIIHGDASISVWRLHHDLVAMSTALGLHCYQGSPHPTIHSEMTKRLSACCFWNDKEISMFTGRPPALSRRYHSCPLALDVSDEALLSGGELLQAELDGLDANGWNTSGRMFNSTICRLMVLAAIIQDEIMELFLGTEEQWSIEHVNALKIKTADIYSCVPAILDVNKDTLLTCEDDDLLWRLLFGRLDYLRIQFLLGRLSTERGQESPQALLSVAREIVELVVYLWLERERSNGRHSHYDYDYIIMCYGMPSTGILCTALLKQVQFPDQVDPADRLPSSEVVQSLSLMIGFLEWIRPSAGNYKLCRRMAKVVRKVLDQVFDPNPELQMPQEGHDGVHVGHVIHGSHEGHEGPEPIWAVSAEESWNIDGLSDWDWLNSIDWSRGPHMDMIQ